jgi:hypothetical protein
VKTFFTLSYTFFIGACIWFALDDIYQTKKTVKRIECKVFEDSKLFSLSWLSLNTSIECLAEMIKPQSPIPTPAEE